MTFDRDTFAAELNRVVADRLEEADAGRFAPGVQRLITEYLHRNAGFVRPRVLYAAAAAYADAPENADESERGDRGGDNAADVLRRLAIATEILHVFALLHDDRIDTEVRPERGSGMADRVLAGDLLYAIGFGLLSETVMSAGLPGLIVEIVRHTAAVTVVGQAADISFAGTDPSIESLLELYDMKTGRYTFVAPLQIGALWAGCPAEDVDRLSEVGIPLGRAYQLRDDLIDLGKLVRPRERSAPGRLRQHEHHDPPDRTDATVRPEDSVPPWEWNLVVAWARSQKRQGASAFTGPVAVTPTVTPADHAEIARFGAEKVAELLRQAEGAAAHLTLSQPRRRRLVTDLQKIYGNVPANG